MRHDSAQQIVTATVRKGSQCGDSTGPCYGENAREFNPMPHSPDEECEKTADEGNAGPVLGGEVRGLLNAGGGGSA